MVWANKHRADGYMQGHLDLPGCVVVAFTTTRCAQDANLYKRLGGSSAAGRSPLPRPCVTSTSLVVDYVVAGAEHLGGRVDPRD
jgi:hypothetical protein